MAIGEAATADRARTPLHLAGLARDRLFRLVSFVLLHSASFGVARLRMHHRFDLISSTELNCMQTALAILIAIDRELELELTAAACARSKGVCRIA